MPGGAGARVTAAGRGPRTAWFARTDSREVRDVPVQSTRLTMSVVFSFCSLEAKPRKDVYGKRVETA